MGLALYLPHWLKREHNAQQVLQEIDMDEQFFLYDWILHWECPNRSFLILRIKISICLMDFCLADCQMVAHASHL